MTITQRVDRFLALHLQFMPVNATFMGIDGHDHELPPADAGARERELTALRDLEGEVARLPVGTTASERIEAAALLGQVRMGVRELESRPRYHNPAWYTGEVAFGIISLLLPVTPERSAAALLQRVAAIPRYLREGSERLAGRAIPADWRTRAEAEGRAIVRLLEVGLPQHPMCDDAIAAAAAAAVPAVKEFVAGLAGRADADPAAGREYLDFLMREVHRLPYSSAEAEDLAQAGFDRALAALTACAQRLNPERSWQEQLADLAREHPDLAGVMPAYERLNADAMSAADAADLVTPATEYGLSFEQLPAWAQPVAADLYFLFYRSPAAGRPGAGSVYWVFPPGADEEAYLRGQNYSTIKITHAVHHGSIGHHTQNARARAAVGQLGRVAGTDCSAGIAMLSGGTLIEGWACYTQNLLLEAEGFYQPTDELVLKHAELRNTAMCLADIRLHTGAWSLNDMRGFYVDALGLPPQRAWSEATRNSMYPATRLMYWLGTRAIKEARAELGEGRTRAFHDELLSYGCVPVYSVIDEMRSGNLPA